MQLSVTHWAWSAETVVPAGHIAQSPIPDEKVLLVQVVQTPNTFSSPAAHLGCLVPVLATNADMELGEAGPVDPVTVMSGMAARSGIDGSAPRLATIEKAMLRLSCSLRRPADDVMPSITSMSAVKLVQACNVETGSHLNLE